MTDGKSGETKPRNLEWDCESEPMPVVERKFLPNDEEPFEKAYVNLKGHNDFRMTRRLLTDILEAICDYEEEKYYDTKRGEGYTYTKRKLHLMCDYGLRELFPEVDKDLYLGWVKESDPKGVMSQRDGWTNSQQKLRVTDDSNGWIAVTLHNTNSRGFYPSFADLWRIIHVCIQEWGYDEVRKIIRQA